MSDGSIELNELLEDLKKKTGIVVRLAPSQGDETAFVFDFHGEKIRAWVEGKGEIAQNAARILQYFLGNTEVRRPEKEETLKDVFLGEGGSWYAYRFMTKYNLPNAPCFAVDVEVDKRLKDAVSHIETCLQDSKDMVTGIDANCCAIVRFSDETQTPMEFARFISQSLYEETGIRASIGVGAEVKSFTELSSSFRQAATALRMSGIFHTKGEVHSFQEYLLVRVLEDVPDIRLKEYMEQLQIENAETLFDDEDMMNTAEEFLENSLNVSETSRNLFMHRNTLMYRLDKIERMTGLNIRKFSDAVTFRVITILYKLLHGSSK